MLILVVLWVREERLLVWRHPLPWRVKVILKLSRVLLVVLGLLT